MRVNVGLAMYPVAPAPVAMPRASTVLPVPSSPVSATTSPRRRRRPMMRPTSVVSASPWVRTAAFTSLHREPSRRLRTDAHGQAFHPDHLHALSFVDAGGPPPPPPQLPPGAAPTPGG